MLLEFPKNLTEWNILIVGLINHWNRAAPLTSLSERDYSYCVYRRVSVQAKCKVVYQLCLRARHACHGMCHFSSSVIIATFSDPKTCYIHVRTFCRPAAKSILCIHVDLNRHKKSTLEIINHAETWNLSVNLHKWHDSYAISTSITVLKRTC